MRLTVILIAAVSLCLGAPLAFAQDAADPEAEANQSLGVKPAAPSAPAAAVPNAVAQPPSSDPALEPKAARTPVAQDLDPDDVVVEEIHTQGASPDSKAARNKHQARPTPTTEDEDSAAAAASSAPVRDTENEVRGSGAISPHEESLHDDMKENTKDNAKENAETADQMQMKMHAVKDSAEATPAPGAKKPKRSQKTAAAAAPAPAPAPAKSVKKSDKKSAAKTAKTDKPSKDEKVAGAMAGQPTADTVMKWLGNGNTRFVKRHFRADGKTQADRDRLMKGEHPHAAILAAADSRVVPEMIFDQTLGEIYDVRAFGETLDSATVAALEYAVSKLKVPLIVVMGNSECAAIKTMLEDKVNENGDHVGDAFTSPDLEKVIADIRPRLKTLKDDPVSPGYEVEATLNADGIARELIKRSDIIREAVEKNQLVIKSALYRLNTGKVSFY